MESGDAIESVTSQLIEDVIKRHELCVRCLINQHETSEQSWRRKCGFANRSEMSWKNDRIEFLPEGPGDENVAHRMGRIGCDEDARSNVTKGGADGLVLYGGERVAVVEFKVYKSTSMAYEVFNGCAQALEYAVSYGVRDACLVVFDSRKLKTRTWGGQFVDLLSEFGASKRLIVLWVGMSGDDEVSIYKFRKQNELTETHFSLPRMSREECKKFLPYSNHQRAI